MTDSPSFGLFVLAIVVGLFAAGVAALIRAAKRQEEQRKQVRQDLGFTEAPEMAEPLTERLRSVHLRWTSSHRLKGLWRKSDWGYELYLFDLTSRQGKSTKVERDQAMVVSPELAAPRFVMFAKIPGDGFAASMANRAIGWVASRFAGRVDFPEDPAFDGKYFVFGDDSTDLRDFFDGRRRGHLVGVEGIQAAGKGDAFLFSRSAQRRAKRPDPENLQDLLQEARTLFEIFKD